VLEIRWSHVWHNRRTLPQDAQNGRPARLRRVQDFSVLFKYVEGLNDARTTLADFFSILLGIVVPVRQNLCSPSFSQ